MLILFTSGYYYFFENLKISFEENFLMNKIGIHDSVGEEF